MNIEDYIILIVILIIGIVDALMPFLVIKGIILLIRKFVNNKSKSNVVVVSKNDTVNYSNNKTRSEYNDISIEKLKEFNTDSIDAFKDYLYDIFYRFETAYNNLDYSSMRLLSTKQLYQNYYTGISLDAKLGKKRIIEKIKREKVILYEIDSTVAKQSASLMVEISYVNYVVDKHGQIISGFRETPITEKFEVEFRKYFEAHDVTKCKNCGATVNGNVCEYCRTKVQTDEFKINAIRKIVEK